MASIMTVLKEKQADKFINGRILGDALSTMIKKLRINSGTKDSVAMFVTNMALFSDISVPAGCPVLDQTFLAKEDDWRMVMFHGENYISTVTSCPFTRASNSLDFGDDNEGQQYVSPIYMLSEQCLAKIGNRFNSGHVNIEYVNDKFELSQASTDLLTVNGVRRNAKPISVVVTCTETTPAEVLDTIEKIWAFTSRKLTLPYRFTGSNGFGGKSASDGEMMRYKYISFTCDKKWMGDGVLEGDTTAAGSDPFCRQFSPITDFMFNDGNVDVSDGKPAKRQKRMTKKEREDEEDARLDAQLAELDGADFEFPDGDDDDNDGEEDSEIGALLKKQIEANERVESSEPRPVIDALPRWFRDLWDLRQSSTTVAQFSCGEATVQAACKAEIVIPSDVVKSINDLCSPINIASSYFIPSPKDDISVLLVMSHSAKYGVTSASVVSPYVKPE